MRKSRYPEIKRWLESLEPEEHKQVLKRGRLHGIIYFFYFIGLIALAGIINKMMSHPP